MIVMHAACCAAYLQASEQLPLRSVSLCNSCSTCILSCLPFVSGFLYLHSIHMGISLLAFAMLGFAMLHPDL